MGRSSSQIRYDHRLRDYESPVAAGDKIRFVVKHNGENRADPIVWDPMIVIRMQTLDSQ